jgi:hypothetical protein
MGERENGGSCGKRMGELPADSILLLEASPSDEKENVVFAKWYLSIDTDRNTELRTCAGGVHSTANCIGFELRIEKGQL